jgi:hypothetical protein
MLPPRALPTPDFDRNNMPAISGTGHWAASLHQAFEFCEPCRLVQRIFPLHGKIPLFFGERNLKQLVLIDLI